MQTVRPLERKSWYCSLSPASDGLRAVPTKGERQVNMSSHKKKIIWLAHEGNLSGANIALLEYVDVLKDEYDFHLILPHEGSMNEALNERSIPVTMIPQYSWIDDGNNGMLRKAVRSFLAIRATKQLIIKENADIIFTNTLAPFTAAKAAHQLQKPHVWWIHEFGEEDFGFRIGWGKPHVAYRKMEKWSRLIICNSEAVTNKFRALMPAAAVKRLYQPVSFSAKPEVAGKKVARFLMFGQITASKGHRQVLEAIAELKQTKHMTDISLHIKGPCENKVYLDELFRFIAVHGLQEQVKIETGFFQKEEVMPLYEALIVASQSEAFGRVIVEANKAGLRVIVKNSGGAPELINETNGILYKDSNELMQILSGEIQLPTVEIKQNYNEEQEIQALKNWLAAY